VTRGVTARPDEAHDRRPARGGAHAAPVPRDRAPAPPGHPAALQRAIGNRATAQLLRKDKPKTKAETKAPAPPPKPPPVKAPAKPRPDYVFIMGEDPKPAKRGQPIANPFYTVALKYWKVHLPNATIVEDKRDLDGVLTYLAGGSDPIGNVYIVSHANEDGTLGFGVDASDTDHHMTVPELREALHPKRGRSTLSSVKSRVDTQTRIHIKGCDIGRTQAMVELIDEAFGGLGKVNAPTHEQRYGIDDVLEAEARKKFHEEIAAKYAAIPELDKDLKGQARVKAKRERDKLVQKRLADIATEEKSRKAEADERAILASHYEAFSGPMFQRPGTQLFTAKELEPELKRLYPHLDDKRRAALAASLVAANRSPANDQHGQRVIRAEPLTFTDTDPRSLAEAQRVFAKDLRAARFTPSTFSRTKDVDGDEFTLRIEMEGKTPGGEGSRIFTTGAAPTDAALLKQGKAEMPNPDAYTWRIEAKHDASGITKRTVVGERVLAYLHHESLDVKPHEHFTRPETDKDFFTTSTFGDPPPPKPAAPKKVSRAPAHRLPAVAAPPARALQRKPSPRPPSGLLRDAPADAYVKAALDWYGDRKNLDKSLAEFALFLHGKANDALQSIGVPATKKDWDGTARFIGQFDAGDWKITMNPARFSDRGVSTVRRLTADEAATGVSMIYHEARHAEQHFRIARMVATTLKPGAPKPKELSLIRSDVAVEAGKQSLPATPANADVIAEAQDWREGTTGRHWRYTKLVDDWGTEVARARAVAIEPMRSEIAKSRYASFMTAWRGADRVGLLTTQLKAIAALGKPTPADGEVAANIKAIMKVWGQVEAAWRPVVAAFDKGEGPKKRLDVLQAYKPLLGDLAVALDTAYHAHAQEADAFRAGDDVARRFLTVLNSP
jgi:hypothetical protein